MAIQTEYRIRRHLDASDWSFVRELPTAGTQTCWASKDTFPEQAGLAQRNPPLHDERLLPNLSGEAGQPKPRPEARRGDGCSGASGFAEAQ